MKHKKKYFIKAFICWVIAYSICAVVFVLCEALILLTLHIMSTDIDMSGALSVDYAVRELVRVCPYALLCGLLVTVSVYNSIKRNGHTAV